MVDIIDGWPQKPNLTTNIESSRNIENCQKTSSNKTQTFIYYLDEFLPAYQERKLPTGLRCSKTPVKNIVSLFGRAGRASSYLYASPLHLGYFNCLGRYYTDGPRKNHVLLVHITVLSYLRATADSTGDFGEA